MLLECIMTITWAFLDVIAVLSLCSFPHWFSIYDCDAIFVVFEKAHANNTPKTGLSVWMRFRIFLVKYFLISVKALDFIMFMVQHHSTIECNPFTISCSVMIA